MLESFDPATQERYREQPAAIKNHTRKKLNLGAPPSVSSTAAETEPNWASIETGRSRNESAQEEHELTGGGSKVRAGKSTIQIWRFSYEQDQGYSMVDVRSLVRNLKRINANRRKLGRAQGSLYSSENQDKEKKIEMEKQESCAAQVEKVIRVHSQTNTKRGI
jgi:hypothetical protein